MNMIDNFLKKYLKLVDSGKIFRNVVKPAYLIIGWLHLLLPLLVIRIAYQAFSHDFGYYDSLAGFLKYTLRDHNVLLAIVLLLLFAAACLAAYLAIKFWKDRARRIDILLNNQSEFCVLPIVVAFVRNKGEGQGMVFTIIGLGLSIALGIGVIFMSFVEHEEFGRFFLAGLGFLIIGSLLSIIVGYLIVVIHRFISEFIGLMVSIATNTSRIANKD